MVRRLTSLYAVTNSLNHIFVPLTEVDEYTVYVDESVQSVHEIKGSD